MNDQTIPAEKVRELIEHFEGKDIGIESYGILGRFRALLPASPQPTSGLLGRWAKHPEHGDVVCVWDKPQDGWINTYKRANNGVTGVEWYQIRFSDLTFPEQATKPEDVPVGEAWLVEQLGEGEQRAFKTDKNEWQTSSSNPLAVYNIPDDNITLIAPLTPERPGKNDLQARYDELGKNWCYLDTKYSALRKDYDALDDKYREAVEKIAELEQATPRTVATEAEYAALPVGSVVAVPGSKPWQKTEANRWESIYPNRTNSDASISVIPTRTVLRYGWGDEQPAPVWRIEHDWRNLRVGEYIIDCVDDGGTVEKIDETGTRRTDAGALGKPQFAPFIVFPSKDVATPEAIEEAKRARDEEMDK